MSSHPALIDDVLDAPALRALAFLGDPPANWVPATPGVDYDVAIVGAGQNGVTIAHALRRQGVSNLTVVDAAAEGEAGVWRHPARMNVLRTPKQVPGPELGIPELSFRYWFEARHGAQAFDALGFIDREDWALYLDWLRALLNVPVRYETRLARVEPQGERLRLMLETATGEQIVVARKLILASGIVSLGGPYVPETLGASLPRDFYSHTSDRIDFSKLADKDIAVLGAAASAFDAAGAALEAGARSVRLFSRRNDIARSAPGRVRAYPGAVNNFYFIPDADRWRYAVLARRSGSTPPRDAVLRAAKHENFHIHFNSDWNKLRLEDGRVHFESAGEPFIADHVIAGTGYRTDVHRQPQFAAISDAIALWHHRYTPPAEYADPELGLSPYLGPAYQFLEKVPGQAPYLANIHVFTAAGSTSFGRPVGDIPSMNGGIPNIVTAVVRDLYFADYDAHLERARQPAKPDFEPELYRSAIWAGSAARAAE